MAFAIIHDDSPRVFVAENEAVLERVLALELVANSLPTQFLPGGAETLRELLLNEQWGFAIQDWMSSTNTVIDFYPDETIWLESDLTEERASLDVRVSRLFSEPE